MNEFRKILQIPITYEKIYNENMVPSDNTQLPERMLTKIPDFTGPQRVDFN